MWLWGGAGAETAHRDQGHFNNGFRIVALLGWVEVENVTIKGPVTY